MTREELCEMKQYVSILHSRIKRLPLIDSERERLCAAYLECTIAALEAAWKEAEKQALAMKNECDQLKHRIRELEEQTKSIRHGFLTIS